MGKFENGTNETLFEGIKTETVFSNLVPHEAIKCHLFTLGPLGSNIF